MPSPFRSDAPDVRLQVRTGNQLAEVFLIDHAFALRARAIGDLEEEHVEPGVYTIKARAGDAVVDCLVLLDRDQEISLVEDLMIGSAVPAYGTARSRESDRARAHAASGEAADVVHGHGARLLLMSRRWFAKDGHDDVPPPELTLFGPGGGAVDRPAQIPDDRGSIVTTADVAPGAYRLRWADRAGITAEQALSAVDGWQTQVFVLENGAPVPDGVLPVAIGRTRVSVLMAREQFNPYEDQLQVVETARTALAEERKVVNDVVSALVRERAGNPMLGLFGAHLMLLARDAAAAPAASSRIAAPVDFDQGRYDAIVGELAALLGAAHPDVVALATQTKGGGVSPQPVSTPPMLWRSWVLLIAASNDAPDLVPEDLWRVVRRTLPLRPFLLWSPPDGEDEDDDAWAQSLAAALGEEAGEEQRRQICRELLVPRAAVDAAAGRAEA